MIKRKYYSVRTGKLESTQKMDFDVLKKVFSVNYNKLTNDGYFQKYFGIDCTDGYTSGELGEEVDAMIFINLRKNNLYPIQKYLPEYTEDDFFDILEFLHDHCSKGLSRRYHDWNNCGYHYTDFNDIEGQKHFRELFNPILQNYKDGFEISADGEILLLSDNGFSNLVEASIPTNDEENISNKINGAIAKFRGYKSTLDDRREAIRELADVLEFLRPTIRKRLDKRDEGDIFNIANNFGIRHHNKDQKIQYDKSIWYSWIFYFYLATIHAVLRMTDKVD